MTNRRSEREPCDICGEKKAHKPGCVAPYVGSIVRGLSKVPNRVLTLALERLHPTHRDRLRKALESSEAGEVDGA